MRPSLRPLLEPLEARALPASLLSISLPTQQPALLLIQALPGQQEAAPAISVVRVTSLFAPNNTSQPLSFANLVRALNQAALAQNQTTSGQSAFAPLQTNLAPSQSLAAPTQANNAQAATPTPAPLGPAVFGLNNDANGAAVPFAGTNNPVAAEVSANVAQFLAGRAATSEATLTAVGQAATTVSELAGQSVFITRIGSALRPPTRFDSDVGLPSPLEEEQNPEGQPEAAPDRPFPQDEARPAEGTGPVLQAAPQENTQDNTEEADAYFIAMANGDEGALLADDLSDVPAAEFNMNPVLAAAAVAVGFAGGRLQATEPSRRARPRVK